MNTKLILLSLISTILIIPVKSACFIYVCDSQVDDIKCVNTTDHWVTKANLNEKKYCECCLNAIIKPGMTSYPPLSNDYHNSTNTTNNTINNSTVNYLTEATVNDISAGSKRARRNLQNVS